MNLPIAARTLAADVVSPAAGPSIIAPRPTLADLVAAVDGFGMERKKRLHLQGRILRLAELLGDTAAAIPLDLADIGERLEKVDRIAAGISAKTITNIRWALIDALGRSGLVPGAPSRGRKKLTPSWQALFADAGFDVVARLSRLAHFASKRGVDPVSVSDQLLNDLMAEMKIASLRQNQAHLHRATALKWNKHASANPHLALPQLSVPPSRLRRTRVAWDELPRSFRDELERYLVWCSGADPFAEDAREKRLNPESVATHKRNIHAGVTSLIHSGAAEPAALRSLADLVEISHVRQILEFRHTAVHARKNYMNASVATVLVQIARDWVKVDAAVLKELKDLSRKVPRPKGEMTAHNRETLRRFEDPLVLRQLDELPQRLWAEVKAAPNPSKWTLAKAQAAIAIGLEIYIPLRLRNLAELSFEKHLHLRKNQEAQSTLEISGDEVKGGKDLAFYLPPHLAAMLIEYHERLAPAIVGRRPSHLFVNVDGVTRKNRATVRYLMEAHLKGAGIPINPHAFRHLAGKRILDQQPGAHEIVKQILGHDSIETTTRFYTGVSTRRAGRYFEQLLESGKPAEKRDANGGQAS